MSACDTWLASENYLELVESVMPQPRYWLGNNLQHLLGLSRARFKTHAKVGAKVGEDYTSQA